MKRNKIARKMASVLTALILTGVAALMPAEAYAQTKAQVDSILKVLNKEIEAAPAYRARKEAKLNRLKADLHNPDGTLDFPIAKKIFKEYAVYQSDSAFHYASLMRRDAEARNDKSALAMANVAFAEYFVSVGFFKEAAEMTALCDSSQLPESELADYYYLNSRLYQALESYVGGPGSQLWPYYHTLYTSYLDSALMTAPRASYQEAFYQIEKDEAMNHDDMDEVTRRIALLERYDMDPHDRAVNYSLIGRALLGQVNANGANTTSPNPPYKIYYPIRMRRLRQ